jgi:2-polyprenyl-3-methyl-5-hydroxy-6-metoxy-1,4-benzoquinol methylase
MTSPIKTRCSVCAHPFDNVVVISALRRSECACGHSERIDVETFDYINVEMGVSGIDADRLRSQADFISRNLKPGLRALEVGCATGALSSALRERCDFSRYHGVEFSPARIEALKHLDAVHDRPLAKLIADGTISPASYDLAIASHCLEHVDDPGALIDSMTEALCSDGALFIEVPNGPGHPHLPFDDNRSHLHFFSVASLSRLLIDRGFQIAAMETGARFDARYVDSQRVIARRPSKQPPGEYFLSDHSKLAGVGKVVVWGAGKMTEELLAHFFDPSRIAYFIDRDPAKQGGTRMGAPVRAPGALRHDPGIVVLVNSLEMERKIREQIASELGDLNLRVVGVSELL